MTETLKDYLISVGMQVDKQSFAQADKSIKGVEKGLGKFAGNAVGGFVKVGAGAAALASAVVVAMAKFATGVAEADRKVGMLARRLYTTKENARSLSIAMKQMNVGSLDELREMAQDPESRDQFMELKNLARSLENPKATQALKEIRAMNQEWRKLMVRFEYFKIEIAGKLLQVFKQMKPTIQKVIDWFKPIVQGVQDMYASYQKAIPNIQKGIKYIWSLLKPIFGFVRAFVMFIIKGWKMIFKGIQQMPTAFKAAFQGIKFILDPIIKIFEWIEDLFVYLTGGKTYGEKMYDKLPFLRNIRYGGEAPMTDEEIAKENKHTARTAQGNLNLSSGKSFRYKYGESVQGFRAGKVRKKSGGGYEIDPKGTLLSQGNILALASLHKDIGNLANKFTITSGWEGGHSAFSTHHGGGAVDFGQAGVSLQNQTALVKAVLQNKNFRKVILEMTPADKEFIYKSLAAQGIDVQSYIKQRKLDYINTPRANANIHVENIPAKNILENADTARQAQYTVTNNFNISSHDPKESITEANQVLTLMFGKGGLTP